MKNTLTINTLKNCTCDCIDSIYDGSNSIFLLFVTDRNSKVEFSNGKTFEITPETNIIFIEQNWYLTNDLTFIFSNDDHTSDEFTIKKPTSTEGNMTLQMIENFTYQVNFHKSSGGGTATTVSVKVNSTTTGEPGTDAVVTNSGNDTNVKLDFVIPRGSKGDKGDKGIKGDTGPQGARGDKGDTGAKGDKGDTGATGPQGIKGDTGPQGLQGPKGDKGDKGDKGATGAKGDKGDKGDTFTYADLTDAQKTELQSDITTYYKKTYYKVSLTSDVSVVTIPDSNYRNGVDILTVYLNGVHLLEGTDYTRTTTGITLTNVAESGNVVEFDILRSIAATAEDYSKLKGDTGEVSNDDLLEAKKEVLQLAQDYTDDKTDKIEIANLIYPIGSIYISVNNVNPSTLFGGEWEQLPTGYLKSGTSYATGGSSKTGKASGNTGATTLTTSQIPAHAHGLNNHTHSLNNHTHGVGTLKTAENGNHAHSIKRTQSNATSGSQTRYLVNTDSTTFTGTATNTTGAHTHTISGATAAASGNTGAASGNTANAGGGGSHTHTLGEHTHTIEPPYVQVYMWKRTS